MGYAVKTEEHAGSSILGRLEIGACMAPPTAPYLLIVHPVWGTAATSDETMAPWIVASSLGAWLRERWRHAIEVGSVWSGGYFVRAFQNKVIFC